MKVVPTRFPEVLLIEPKIFGDVRGFFFESWNEREFERAGIHARFVQDNHSRSEKGVLRGLHYQIARPQGKLVRVTEGEIFDVAVDIRRSSPTSRQWEGTPERAVRICFGFRLIRARVLCAGDFAEVLYKATDFYAPEHERCILWNDSELKIDWPLSGTPLVSPKDAAGKRLRDAEVFP
jgi:dTDP-4-dehydrorhamnose 3,5-epimerase